MEITRQARAYAARELLRRAGLSRRELEQFHVTVEADRTILTPGWQPEKRVVFHHPTVCTVRAEDAARMVTVRREWMAPPAAAMETLVPSFVVPFQSSSIAGKRALCRTSGQHCVEVHDDLLLATLLTLSRWEETLPGERDQHGRFTAEMSVATREGFLHRPIVDEYGLALQQALEHLLPGWKAEPRRLRVNLSHDVDHVGLPFAWRRTAGHLARRGNWQAGLRDVASVISPLAPAELNCVAVLNELSQQHGLQSAFYFKASPKRPFDSGYNIHHPRVVRMLRRLMEQEVECGVHPGYYTFGEENELIREVASLRAAIGLFKLGGRQHYLRWSPAMWNLWERAELVYDSTVGFADCVGFRASTCHPYRPWLWEENREANLIELPLVAMDGTLRQYMNLSLQECHDTLAALVRRCRAVGGVFTLLWHPDKLLDPAYGTLYIDVLADLASSPGCNVRSEVPALPSDRKAA